MPSAPVSVSRTRRRTQFGFDASVVELRTTASSATAASRSAAETGTNRCSEPANLVLGCVGWLIGRLPFAHDRCGKPRRWTSRVPASARVARTRSRCRSRLGCGWTRCRDFSPAASNMTFALDRSLPWCPRLALLRRAESVPAGLDFQGIDALRCFEENERVGRNVLHGRDCRPAALAEHRDGSVADKTLVAGLAMPDFECARRIDGRV